MAQVLTEHFTMSSTSARIYGKAAINAWTLPKICVYLSIPNCVFRWFMVHLDSFYADSTPLCIGLGFATRHVSIRTQRKGRTFLFPRYRAGLCDLDLAQFTIVSSDWRFYALGIGLGFATTARTTS
jgi:hypothetical protein